MADADSTHQDITVNITNGLSYDSKNLYSGLSYEGQITYNT